VFEQHLGDLGGFAGAGGGLQNETFRRTEGGDEVGFDIVNGQPFGHGPGLIREGGTKGETKTIRNFLSCATLWGRFVRDEMKLSMSLIVCCLAESYLRIN